MSHCLSKTSLLEQRPNWLPVEIYSELNCDDRNVLPLVASIISSLARQKCNWSYDGRCRIYNQKTAFHTYEGITTIDHIWPVWSSMRVRMKNILQRCGVTITLSYDEQMIVICNKRSPPFCTEHCLDFPWYKYVEYIETVHVQDDSVLLPFLFPDT